jgi:hypothetical protein
MEHILFANVRGVLTKTHTIEEYIRSNPPAFIVLNETFLKPGKPYKILGYEVVWTDRQDIRGGGILIAVRSGTASFNIITSDSENEVLMIEAMVGGGKIRLASYYNKPLESPKTQVLDAIFEDDNTPTLLIGDLNSPHVSLGSLYNGAGGQALEKYLNKNPRLTLLNSECPTYYIDGRNKLNLIDVAICNAAFIKHYKDCNVGEDINSDHLPLHINVDFNTVPPSRSSRTALGRSFKYSDENLQQFQELMELEFANLDPSDTDKSDTKGSVDTKIDLLVRTINETRGRLATEAAKRAASLANAKLANMLQEKRRLRRLYQRTRNPELKTMVNNLAKSIKQENINCSSST